MADGTAENGFQAALPPGFDDRTRLVTRRPGRSAWLTIGLAAIVVAIVQWIGPQVAERRDLWDQGTPVVLVVLASGQRVVVEEYGGGSSWIVPLDDLPDVVIGDHVQARTVGDGSRLMLDPPQGLPWWFGYTVPVLVASSVPALLARLRWRGLDRVLQREPRRVELDPVWIRSGRGTTAALRVHVPSEDGGKEPQTMVLEVRGTPVPWLLMAVSDDTSGPVAMYGPDTSGLVVLETRSGRAVASSSPRRGPRGERIVQDWSDRLALTLGFVNPTDPLISVGGEQHQHVSVGARAGEAAGRTPAVSSPFVFDMSRLARRHLAAPLIVSAGCLAVYFGSGGSPLALLVVPLGIGGVAVAHNVSAARLAEDAPFQDWSDRATARQAAKAARQLGARRARPGEIG